MKQPTPAVPNYQPQMDGLRALAVIAVLLHHYEGPFNTLFNFGTLGVRFFFVMSGFLITKMLLRSRKKWEQSQTSWLNEWSHFQLRRLMRTVPVYWLSLFLAAVLALPSVRESLFWTMTFLTNFYMGKLDYFPDTISHFWSLAVQEQFYLFWPFLIFFLPRNWIKYSFPLLIVTALLFRLFCIYRHLPDAIRWFSLPGSFDCFAMGGILAYVAMSKPLLMVKTRTRLWTGCVALSAVVLAGQLRYLPLQNTWTIWIELLEAGAMGWLVACSVAGFRGWLGKFLSWTPLAYVGRISYGIYVYHILVAVLLHPVLQHYGWSGHDGLSDEIRFFSQFFITVGLASLSWHYFERPILSSRKRVATWFTPRPLLVSSETCT